MTSQKYSAEKSSAKFDLKQAFKANIAPAVFLALFCCYQFVIQILDFIGSIIKSAQFVNWRAILREEVSVFLTGESSYVSITIGCCLAGILFALTNFYIMKKRNVNFYLALPVDRATLFKNRLISALTYIFGIYFVSIFIDCLINMYYLPNKAFIIKMALALFAECVIYTLASFIIVTIGIVSCYTIIEGLFFSAGLLAFPTVAAMALNSLGNSFIKGYTRADIFEQVLGYSSNSTLFEMPSLLTSLANYNPFLLGKAVGSDYLGDTIFDLAGNYREYIEYGLDNLTQQGKSPDYTLPNINYFIPLIAWAAVFVIFVLIARRIFINRKAENTELHASNKTATFIFGIEFALAALSLAFINDGYDSSVIILVPVVLAVSFYIVTAISKRKLLLGWKNYVIPPVLGLVIMLSCLAVSSGSGLPTPKIDEIEAASITSFVDATHDESVSDYFWDFPIIDGYSGYGLGVFTEKEDLEKLLKVVDDVSTNNKNTQNKEISVAYFLRNGKKIVRSYSITNEYACLEVLSLTDTKAYKEQLKYFLTGEGKDIIGEAVEKYGIDKESFLDHDIARGSYLNGETAEIEQSLGSDSREIKNSKELREALYKDLEASDYMQRFCPTEKELCILCFYDKYDYYADYDSGEEAYYIAKEDVASVKYRVYPSMKNTVNYLKSIDALKEASLFENEPYQATIIKYKDVNFLDTLEDISPENTMFAGYTIDKADWKEINGSNGFKGFNSMYGENVVKNKEQLNELINKAQPYKFANDEDLVVVFETKDEKNTEYYSFMIIDKSNVPEFAK